MSDTKTLTDDSSAGQYPYAAIFAREYEHVEKMKERMLNLRESDETDPCASCDSFFKEVDQWLDKLKKDLQELEDLHRMCDEQFNGSDLDEGLPVVVAENTNLNPLSQNEL